MHGALDVKDSDPNEVGTVSVSKGASVPKRTRSDSQKSAMHSSCASCRTVRYRR